MGASEAEFAAFVASRQRRLLRAAWLLTGDWMAAEDLVQATLAKVWRHWSRVVDAGDPDAYVRRILVNGFLSGWRRRWRGERPSADLPDTASRTDLAGEVTTRLAVRAALDRLPRRQRAVLVLRYFDDLTETQTAEALGCAVGTVKSTAAKALATLRSEPALGAVLEEVRP